MFFFFSSRRRHTRYIGDWSSDVCSSDLLGGLAGRLVRHPEVAGVEVEVLGHGEAAVEGVGLVDDTDSVQIGRASCRERVYISVVAGSTKIQTKEAISKWKDDVNEHKELD